MSELGDLLELMHGARHRYRTVRATIREWRHVERARQAFERANESRRGTMYAWVASDEREDPETHESRTRVWYESAERFRVEELSGDRAGHLTVQDGTRWSVADPEGRVLVNEGDDDDHLTGALRPYEHLLDPALLLGFLDLRVAGRPQHSGRPAIRVEASPRALADDLTHRLLEGADAYELVVDSERGVLLETKALVAGQPAHVTSVEAIEFDEVFAPDTFVYSPPSGARVRRTPLAPRLEQLTLEEAAQRAPFQLWKVPRLDPNWSLRVLYVDDDGEETASANLHYFREDAAEQFSVVHRATGARGAGPPRNARALTRRGEQFRVLEVPGRSTFAVVWLVRNETSLELHSQQKTADELVELAASLVPV